MASDENKVDLSSVNRKKNKKLSELKNPLKKQKGPARDNEGKFTSGSGGLRQLNFNWKRALPVILVVALTGGFLVYRSFAGPNTGFHHENLVASESLGVTKVRENRASKRNATVVEVANPSNVTTARAVYRRALPAGRYEMCLIGVAQRGTPSGSFSARNLATGVSLGADYYTARNTADYSKVLCFDIGENGASGSSNVEVRVTNTTPNSALRISIILFEDRDSVAHHENCTPGQLGAHGPCPDMRTLPQNGVGRSSASFDSTTYRGGEPSAFRSRCDYSHMNNDDSILFPGQPGRAHLHAYFGNTLTNASSTSESLRTTGNSTCAGGTFNRSAYWVPSMVDRTNGRIIKPSDPRSQYNSDLEIYYKLGYQGIGYRDVNPFPNGLHMIAGNAANATGPTPNNKTWYWCETMSPGDREHRLRGPSIPNCGPNQILVMEVQFPQCWDGRLTTSNGRDHLAYGTWQPGDNPNTTGCPASHPRGLPFIQMFVRYPTGSTGNANWRLTSDRYTNGPGGYSGHADYMFAWDNSAFPLIVRNCYTARIDCAYNLGDGREPAWRRDVNWQR